MCQSSKCAISGLISTKQPQIVHNDIPEVGLGDNSVFMADQRPVLSGGMKAVNFALQGRLAGQTQPDAGSTPFPANPELYPFPPSAPTQGSALLVPKDGLYQVDWTLTLTPIAGSLDFSSGADTPVGYQNVMVGAARRHPQCDLEWRQVTGSILTQTIGAANGSFSMTPFPAAYSIAGIGLVNLREGELVALQNFSYDSNDNDVRQDIALSQGKYVRREPFLPDLATLRVTRVGHVATCN